MRHWLPRCQICCYIFFSKAKFSLISGHPNVKLFITHGGNSGVIEAISAGIPVLGFPIFFDQPRNLELFQQWGSGLFVDYNSFTKEDFVSKIKQILSDNR